MAIYHGEELNYIPAYEGIATDFFGDDALWINAPEQRRLPYMVFVGGFPDEWCVPLKNLPREELKQLITDNPKDKKLIACCNHILQNMYS